MAYVKCSSCGEIVEIPAELCDDVGEVQTVEPYYCDACEIMGNPTTGAVDGAKSRTGWYSSMSDMVWEHVRQAHYERK